MYTWGKYILEHSPGYMLGHKTSLKFIKIEIISHILSDHNGMKLGIRRIKLENSQICELNNMLLKNGSKKKSKEKSENTLKQMKM